MIVQEQVKVFRLIRHLSMYTFRVLENDQTEVIHKTKWRSTTVIVPSAEARDLWKRLVKGGYEPW